MLSRVLQLFVLISCAAWLAVASADDEQFTVTYQTLIFCNGTHLSLHGNEDYAAKIDEFDLLYKYCTHIIGDIFIANLTNQQLPDFLFRRVRSIRGSIIVLNNRNVSPIRFPNLRALVAQHRLPAIIVLNNSDVDFSIGRLFRVARTSHQFTFAVLKNRDVMLDKAQYNIWHLAGRGNGTFLVDSNLGTEVCLENFFKPLAGCLGFLFVALTVAFSTVAFYDRPKKNTCF